MGGGTKSDDFGVCVGVPSQFFWSVPANGIKRVVGKPPIGDSFSLHNFDFEDNHQQLLVVCGG